MEADFDFRNVLGKDNRYFFMGIAMLWIVGYHIYLHDMAFYHSSFTIIRNVFKYGYVGVDIFFFFSAYGLCHSFVNSKLGNFYKKRFVRIIPIFVFFVLLKHFIIGGADFITLVNCTLLQITSLSMIQTSYTCPENIQLDWFVPAILNLYILFPIFFKLIDKLYKSPFKLQLAFVVLIYFGAHFLWGYIHGLYITRLPIIFVGIFTFFYLKDKKIKELFLIYAIFAFLTYFNDRDNLRLSCLVPLILYAFSMMKINSNGFVVKCIRKIGELSFEIFLAHCFALYFCTPYNVAYTWLLTIGLTIVFTYILHIINEKMTSFLLAKE